MALLVHHGELDERMAAKKRREVGDHQRLQHLISYNALAHLDSFYLLDSFPAFF